MDPAGVALELGCGYGRVFTDLRSRTRDLFGVDTSRNSLKLAAEMFRDIKNIHLFEMDATALGFQDDCFDLVFCIQNGVSAFGVNPVKLVCEAVRVARPSGFVLFSSYTEGFWTERLKWFELQASASLLGEIDHEATGNGIIVCKDGFRSGTVGEKGFKEMVISAGEDFRIEEVDQSSLFCVIQVKKDSI